MNIEKLAREAGMDVALNMGSGSCVSSEGCNGVTQSHLERFAALVRNEALEEAAVKAVDIARLAAEQYEQELTWHQPYAGNRVRHVGWNTADAIRSMKEVKT